MKKENENIRIRQVQEWLLQGHLVTDICRNIIKLWSIDQPAALEYIASAFDDFTKQTKQGYQETKAYHVQLRLSLYKQAMEAKEFKTALQVLTDLAKIDGVYPE
jgi:hypothetical protein